MTILSCPACENSTLASGKGIDLEAPFSRFERRGKVGRQPVFKCVECGAIMIVRNRLFGRGLEAEAVEDETWLEMESAWQRRTDELSDRDR